MIFFFNNSMFSIKIERKKKNIYKLLAGGYKFMNEPKMVKNNSKNNKNIRTKSALYLKLILFALIVIN